MSQTEAEMFAQMAKSDETGQLVYTGAPAGPADADLREMFDRGWQDVSLFGMPTRYYGGSMLGLAIATMCADVKARDFAKTEMLLWERVGRGWRAVEPRNHPIARLLLEQPNETDMSWPEFWRMVILHLDLMQNAYVYKDISDEGDILGLYPLMPPRVRRLVHPTTSRIFYEVYAGTEFERAVLGTDYFVVPAERIVHFRGRLYDGADGLSNGVLGSPIFAMADAIGRFQTNLFDGGGRQTLVFETDAQFPDNDKGNVAFRRLKDQLTERVVKAYSQGVPILLEAGMKAKPVNFSSRDSTTVESYAKVVMQICGLMQTPPHKIFALESVAYNNMAGMDRMYANDCLLPIAVNVENKLRNSLLRRKDWAKLSPQFDRGQLMANDPETLEKLIKTGMSTGLLTVNEGREFLPFRVNPIGEGGDDRTVPVNMALVKPDGTVRVAATGQNATNPGAGEGESPDNNAPAKEEASLRLVASKGAA